MASLAFDKQGKPFTFQRRTKKLLVRLFRNPSARGTCCQVLGVDGQPLNIDPETDYVEFRRAVNQVPGLYRLDQCDEDGNELDDAQAAYVSIETARNAQTGDAAGDVNPLVIIQQMAAIQADVMKTMAQPGYWRLTTDARTFRADRAETLPDGSSRPRDGSRASQRYTHEGRTILRDGEAILHVERVDLGNERYAISPHHADLLTQRIVRLVNQHGAR